MSHEWKKLFEPGKIGCVHIKNRLVMAAMGTHSCDVDGFITDKALSYYSARARGGVGLVIVQGTSITKGDNTPKGMRIYDDTFIPGLKKLSAAIHDGGAKAFLQLNHHGRMYAKIRLAVPNPEEVNIIGPSAIPSVTNSTVPKAMSIQDIKYFVEAFANASRRAKDAGFDGVQIHAAHGYLLHTFLSPLTNRRNDEYGGSSENRARIVCEVIKATKLKVGSDFPVTVRVSGTEYLEGGIQIEDVVFQAPMYVQAGADAIDVSSCTSDYLIGGLPTYLDPDGAMVSLAKAVKGAVNVPVITVGKLGDPVLADRVLQEGQADFVALGRPLLADPELPNKAREGRLQDINYCLSCNNCFMLLFAGGNISDFTCTVNPSLLAEADSAVRQIASPKKVMVIGGGLAGMVAARDLALRGHKVSLHEKSGMLGGQWNIVCKEDHKAGFQRFSDYLERGLKKAGVKVSLNSDVTSAFVKESNPEAVVLATGASPASLDVPGADGKNVVLAVDVITGKGQVGHSVVVIGGCNRATCKGAGCGSGPSGCQVGMEVALQLAGKGKKVTLATRRELGGGVEAGIYLHLRNDLIDQGVQIFAHSPVVEIRETGAYVTHQNRALFLKGDTVVLAVGSQSENRIAEQLKGLVPELHMIGDCVEPRTAIHATQDASRVARLI